MLYNSSDLTFVVQGPFQYFDGISTLQVLESIRLNYPKSKIIFSISGELPSTVNVDRLVDSIIYVEDVGPTTCGYIGGKKIYENVNRQVNGVFEGIKYVTTAYSVKTRTDFLFVNRSLLDIIGLQLKANNFKNKISIIDVFSRRFYYRNFRLFTVDYHFSDFIQVGRTEDLKKFWSLGGFPDDNNDYQSVDDYPTVEQRIYRRFYYKYNKKIDLLSPRNVSNRKSRNSIEIVLKDFFVYNSDQLGIILPRRFRFSWLNNACFVGSDSKIIQYLLVKPILSVLNRLKIIDVNLS
ncbi:WavE lipopolysaccharide synthesis family protein [Shewanella sp. SW24]|uniref:WavE lipopolysaccharide synthesis family protein n=1 Tax=Shewanella sp. SW24 TaxID=2912815 RepID=UPI0021D7E5A4|nr:WavE lipopolysaccharide synthesis family protein [Shewanella sp. SW24]MCU7987576.1 WavE lipopolysaccharide synthesis family protein [Shewanella sp. SW24]